LNPEGQINGIQIMDYCSMACKLNEKSERQIVGLL